MPKKKVKKSASRSKKSSWLDKIFSLKKIFVYSLIITVASFYSSYSIHSSSQVQGISTVTDDYTIYSKSELNSLAKADPEKYRMNRYLAVELDKDDNKNGVPNETDGCLAKKYIFTVNGHTKTRTQSNDCTQAYIKVPSNKNCNTVVFKKTETSTKYDFSYIEYEIGYYKFKHVHTKSKEICGFPETGGDEVGYMFNRVSFGVKAQ